MIRLRHFIAATALALLGGQAGAAELTVTTHTASEAGFLVNSHLIAGENDAILVDAQFTRSEAAKVAQMVRASGKNLKAIFVTHAHPDHFFGLEVLRKEFPHARIMATRETIADMEVIGPKSIEFWKPTFKDEIPEDFVRPQPVNSTSLFVEGKEIQLIAMDGGESEHATVLYVPSLRALAVGDLAYNKVHLWLRENRPEAWLDILDRLQRLSPALVLTGHGATAGPEILEENRRYLQTYLDATKAPATRQSAIDRMKSQYADYALPVIVDFAVPARIQ